MNINVKRFATLLATLPNTCALHAQVPISLDKLPDDFSTLHSKGITTMS